MAISTKRNQNLMNLVKKVHGIVENTDLEKHRLSQDHFGVLLGNSKEVDIKEFEIEGIHGEWISVNRAHMKKYIILYCHGGGYSTSLFCGILNNRNYALPNFSYDKTIKIRI